MATLDDTKEDATTLKEAAHKAFDLHPEDVISPARCGAEAFHWLDEIFKTIRDEARNNALGCTHRIKHLADAGAYLAFDYANYCGSQYEGMARHLSNAGIDIGGKSV